MMGKSIRADDGGGRPAASATDPQHAPSMGDGRTAPFLHRVLVRANERNVLVNMNDIRWIGAERSYARIHLASVSYSIRISLGRMAERLDPDRFARIHRSTIVNLDHVREVVRWFGSDYLVRLHNGAELRLSRSYWRRLKERLMVVE